MLSTYSEITKVCKRDFTHLNSRKSLEAEILIWIFKKLWHFPGRKPHHWSDLVLTNEKTLHLLSLSTSTSNEHSIFVNNSLNFVLFVISHVNFIVNGKSESVPRDQVFPFLDVYCSLLLQKGELYNASFIHMFLPAIFFSILRYSQLESEVCRLP